MKPKFTMILMLMALGVQLVFAQQKTVSGTVSDENGLPLPGATVIRAGTSSGTSTDFDGKYQLRANSGDVLEISYVGYTTQSITVGASNTYNVSLTLDNTLYEVIIVGYGTTTKKSFTGTIKTIDQSNIDSKSVSNIAQALSGEASGVSVVRTNGRPGADANIRIRGFSSIQGNRTPLYVVDGIPFSGSINSINPGDIESTSILKDASATAIYGARGANGVVMITTKSGKSGSNYIEFESNLTVNQRSLPLYDLVNNEEEYIGLIYNALKNTAEFNGNANPTQDALNQLFTSSRGIAPLYNMWNVANGAELIDVSTGKVKKGVTRKYSPHNWAEHGYRTGIRQQVNFRMSGGSQKLRHFFSLGYLDDKGYINKSQFSRYSARLNLSAKPTKWLDAKTNLGYTNSENNDATGYGGGNVTYMLDYTPTIYPLFLRDTDGNIVMDENSNAPKYDFGDNVAGNARNFSATYNGIGESIYNINRTRINSINANISLIANLYEGLTFETSYGVNIYDSNLGLTRNSIQGSAGVSLGGTLFLRNSRFTAQSFNQILRYKKAFSDKNNIEALVAHETNQDSFGFNDLSKKGIVNLNPDAALIPDNYIDQNNNSGGFTRKSKLESFFGQINYDFDGKYYLSGTLRRDGSSRFFKNKWGTFWSTGAGWILSREDFLSSSKTLNYLKFKVSYGVLGDQGGVNKRFNEFVDGENYAGADYYGGQGGFDIKNLLGAPSLISRPIIDPDITWETSNHFQTGLEFELLEGRIEASLDYYTKRTSNLFVDKRLASSTGDDKIRTNDGELLNKGFEFDVTGHLFKKEDFKLSLSINGEMFDNEIVKMPIDNVTKKEKYINISGRFGHSKGKSIYDFYIKEWAGVNKDNGNPQWVQHWVDNNNNNQYDDGEGIVDLVIYTSQNPNKNVQKRLTSKHADATKKYVNKSLIPKIRGAFRFNAIYKGFSLSAQLGYSLGGYGYDLMYSYLMSNGRVGGASYHADMRDSWKKPGDITDIPRLYSNENKDVNFTSTRFIISTDYLALNNFRLGYDFPSAAIKKVGLSSLNIWLSGDNLFLFSKRKGYNPTTSVISTSGRYTYNPITSYTLGVKIKI